MTVIYSKPAEKKPKFDVSLGAWLDRLSRGQYASANIAEKVLENKPEEIFEAGFRGLTGEEKGSYRDIAETYGLPAPFWVGLAGDILLDPITYIPISPIAKAISKPIARIPAVQKAGKAIYASAPVQKIGSLLIPHFRPAEVAKEQWTKLVNAKIMAKNLERVGKEETIDYLKPVISKLDDMVKTRKIDDDALDLLRDSLEKRSFETTLSPELKPVWDKLTQFADTASARRQAIGKSLLVDEDYSYWLHSLSDAEKKAMNKTGGDMLFREFSTRSPSDIHRKIQKFVSLTNPAKVGIGKASNFKLLPLGVKGIDKNQMGELFASTIQDVSDLQDVAKIYGIKIKFTPKGTTSGGALGSWQPKGRYFRVATGGLPQEDWISTVAHELGHVVHGEIGSYSSLWTPSLKRTKDLTARIPKGQWGQIEEKIIKLSDESKEKIWSVLNIPEEKAIKSKYYNAPTEIFARYVQVIKKDPVLAKNIAPELYDTTIGLFNKDAIGRQIRNIFLSPSEFDETFDVSRIFKNPKTKELYIAKEPLVSEVNETMGREFFSEDIGQTGFLMGARIAKQEAGTAFFNQVRELGNKISLPGWEKIPEFSELKGLYFNPAIKNEINKTIKSFISDEPTKEALKIFDNMQNFWKAWTLGVFPAYHTRNMVGNIWNNYLAGVVSPLDYNKARVIQVKMLKKLPLTIEEETIVALARKNNVLGKGIMGAEIPRLYPQEGKGILEFLQMPAQKGMDVGRHIEDNSRLAHFINKTRKGLSPEEAAMSVKKYLFDYSELTDFERNVLRRVFPFYSWTRKNIPLQVEAMAKTPGKVAPVGKVMRAVEEEAGISEREKNILPSWVQERTPVIFKKQGDQYSFFPIESWLPLADINKIFRASDVLGELLSPIFKVPLELSLNRSWYFNQPIEDYSGETEEFLKIDMPARVKYIASQIRALNEIDKFLDKSYKTSYPSPSMSEKATRFFTGIKIYRGDIKKATKSRTWDIEKDVAALKIGLKRAKRFGRLAETERIQKQIIEFNSQIAELKKRGSRE